MKKVHISLVGGQAIPVYIGIKDDKDLDCVVLICSERSRDEAIRIQAQFPQLNVELVDCPPVDLNGIEKVANDLKNKYNEYEKVVNITGGLKPWSLTFFMVFGGQEKTKVIYIDQTNLITDILKRTSHRGEIEVLKRFELSGTPLKSHLSISEYTESDKSTIREIEKLRLKNKVEFNKLTNGDDSKKIRKTELEYTETTKGSWLKLPKDSNKAKICLMSYGKIPNPVYKTIECDHIRDILFNNGWFELKTALEIAPNTHVKNVWLNCEFTDTKGNPKNEIDIIAELDNRLIFVECKTMIFDSTDIDKFKSATRNFSGTSSASLFVTLDPITKGNRDKYSHALEKCKDNDIETFNFTEWKNNPTTLPHIGNIIDNILNTQNKK